MALAAAGRGWGGGAGWGGELGPRQQPPMPGGFQSFIPHPTSPTQPNPTPPAPPFELGRQACLHGVHHVLQPRLHGAVAEAVLHELDVLALAVVGGGRRRGGVRGCRHCCVWPRQSATSHTDCCETALQQGPISTQPRALRTSPLYMPVAALVGSLRSSSLQGWVRGGAEGFLGGVPLACQDCLRSTLQGPHRRSTRSYTPPATLLGCPPEGQVVDVVKVLGQVAQDELGVGALGQDVQQVWVGRPRAGKGGPRVGHTRVAVQAAQQAHDTNSEQAKQVCCGGPPAGATK
jgi:hypothetical protein